MISKIAGIIKLYIRINSTDLYLYIYLYYYISGVFMYFKNIFDFIFDKYFPWKEEPPNKGMLKIAYLP